MPLIREIRSVWVPFEVKHPADEEGNVCGDIPRFTHPEECKDFIQLNSRRLRGRLIQFREHFETEYKEEFSKGMGRNRFWRYGPPRDPDGVPTSRRSDRDY